jgi:hypothetical protein
MLIYSMSVSVAGFIADREDAFAWTAPSEELFRFHLAQVRELGGFAPTVCALQGRCWRGAAETSGRERERLGAAGSGDP